LNQAVVPEAHENVSGVTAHFSLICEAGVFTMQATRALHSRANHRAILFVVLATIPLISVAAAQEKVANVKKVPMTYTNRASGSEMYTVYCAVCPRRKRQRERSCRFRIHESTYQPDDAGKKNNNEKYPAEHVYTVLRFGTPVPAHGNIQMPVWNTLFRSLNSAEDPDSVTKLRLHNLVDHIQSIQAK
jgi:hypothetical protein